MIVLMPVDETPLARRLRLLRPADGAGELARPGETGDVRAREVTAAWVRGALEGGLLDLPLPGGGRTVERFAALAQLGATDLDVARLAEAHADAQAILAELAPGLLGAGEQRRRLWGVWAANPPQDPLAAHRVSGGWVLQGTKPWCSGAGCCDAALVTARADDGYRLFAVALDGETSRPVEGTWPARSMRGSDSRSVQFLAAPAHEVGDPEEYLQRPGFWHGAVGVAAVWLGGASGVFAAVRRAHGRRPLHPHALAHAGAIDALLAAAQALLDQAGADIDDDPRDSRATAAVTARRVRAVAERSAAEVVDRVGRALGPAPLAQHRDHSKRVGDLELYLRQGHAELDLEELGRQILETGP
jgi:alkylation response protein AidB-like acyl-CoA dehydrogenase